MAGTFLFCRDIYIAVQRGMRRAARLAEKAPDIDAVTNEIEADHEFEEDSEPKVLARFSRTPEE